MPFKSKKHDNECQEAHNALNVSLRNYVPM